MKVHVLFDDKGKIGAIVHSKIKTKDGTESEIRGGFIVGEGEHMAILDVPAELEHLTSRELLEAVRVENKAESHYLTAIAKR